MIRIKMRSKFFVLIVHKKQFSMIEYPLKFITGSHTKNNQLFSPVLFVIIMPRNSYCFVIISKDTLLEDINVQIVQILTPIKVT